MARSLSRSNRSRTSRRGRPLRAAVLAACALLLAACAPSSEIRSSEPIGTLRPPRVTLAPSGARIERFDPPGAGSQIALTVPTDVTNPNDFPLHLTRIDYQLRVEGVAVGEGALEPDLRLEPGASARLRFEPVGDLGRRSRLLAAVVRAFAGEPLEVALEGTLEFSSPGFAFTTRRLVLAAGGATARRSVVPPAIAFDTGESNVYLLRPDAPVVRVVLRAANPGDLGYLLYGRDLRLRLGGSEIAREDLRPQPLPAGTEARVDLLFYPVLQRLDPGARSALAAALAGTPTRVELDGALRMDVLGIDSFDVPDGWGVGGFVSAERNRPAAAGVPDAAGGAGDDAGGDDGDGGDDGGDGDDASGSGDGSP